MAQSRPITRIFMARSNHLPWRSLHEHPGCRGIVAAEVTIPEARGRSDRFMNLPERHACLDLA